jgi:hypothetical protein
MLATVLGDISKLCRRGTADQGVLMYCLSHTARTTLQADTRSYISMPASAIANDAAVMATAASAPPDSKIRQYTSTFALGNVCRCTAASKAACTVAEMSLSSALWGGDSQPVSHAKCVHISCSCM